MSAPRLLCDMLSQSATVQTLLGAASVSAALARIVLDDGDVFDPTAELPDVGNVVGDTIDPTPPLIVVIDLGITSRPYGVPAVDVDSGECEVLLVLPQPDAATLTGTTLMQWALDQQLAIRADLRAQVGAVGALSRASITPPPASIPADLGPFADAVLLPLLITWS